MKLKIFQNDDSIYQRHLNESMADELLHSSTNRKHNTIKTLTHTQTPQHNYIDFVKTESPHKIHKINCDSRGHEHAIDTRKVIRELTHDSVTGHYYAITDGLFFEQVFGELKTRRYF